jgi:uncharacterized protein YndB with AHSA1/START domain
MKDTLSFQTSINASAEKVWDIMLQDKTYRQWTAAFDPTSYYEGTWEKGSSMKFLGSEGNGMIAEIAENELHKFISIKQLGMIKDGIEDTVSDEAKKWANGYENYTFIENGDHTTLKVDLEMEASEETEEVKKMFSEMWPNALLKLKELCEK